METDFIQLPPMPFDMPTEFVAIVWIYARMEKTEKEQYLDFIQNNIKSNTNESKGKNLIELMGKSKLKPSPYVEEFHSLMQKLIGTLIVQACETSAFIYQKYCVEKNP